MGEIKFRQAIFRNGKFHHWHYWGYVGYRDEFVAPITIGQQSWDKTYEVKPDQQYTGLRGAPVSTGKEIYEGDIVKLTTDLQGTRILTIVWSDDLACFLLRNFDQEMGLYSRSLESANCRVIGNIMENPELLEVNDR